MKLMSNVDINAVSYELNDLLEGARVDKSFQLTNDTVIMRFHVKGSGRIDVIFQAGVRIHTTQYPPDNPKFPPSFPMVLRKHLKGANVVNIKQHHFDRVVEIKMKKEKSYTLIIELFSKGNIILLDDENSIILPLKRKQWSDRNISSKKKYKFPLKRGINPLSLSQSELNELFKNSNTDLIRTLAINGLGRIYSEEIIRRSGIDKKKPAIDLSVEEISEIYETIIEIFTPLIEHNYTPNIVISKNSLNKSYNEEDVLPLELELYSDDKKYKKQYFANYNKAADEFFSKKIKNEIKSTHEAVWAKKVGKFAKRLKTQKEALKKFEKSIKASKEKGDLIYANYSQIESLLKVIEDARSKKYSWKDIAKKIKKAKKSGMKEVQIVESIDNLGNLVLDIDNTNISIDSNLPIPENAEIYYEKAKKSKRKIDGVLVAINNTKKQLKKTEDNRDVNMENIKVTQKRVKKELKWYEKLRWFLSSDDFFVIGGRDAGTNEAVVKKYLDNNDIYLHSTIHGASSVVIKTKDKKVNDNTLKESAIFAASFSNAWSKNYGTQDVYWVHPDQVSKSPESGEFVTKGSFIVRGKRNHIRGVNLKIAVGIVDYEGKRIMAGPINALKAHSDNYITIKPGYTKKEAIAKKIFHKINKDNFITLDDVVRVLPSGKCDFV